MLDTFGLAFNASRSGERYGASLDPEDWDWTRGVGATRWIPVTSCAEENLLCWSTDVYRGENICVPHSRATRSILTQLKAGGKVRPSASWHSISVLKRTSKFLIQTLFGAAFNSPG